MVPIAKKLTRSEQREQTRAKILQCALEEFSRHGYDGANLRAVAERAGQNHGLIKYYFGSKEELWKAAVGFMFERQNEEVVFEPGADLAEAIGNYIRSYTRYCARHPEHARIMIQASMHSRDRLQWAVENYLLPGLDEMLQVVALERATGRWRDISDVSLIYSIVSCCQMVFALDAEVKLLHGIDVHDEAFIAQHADAVVAMVMGLTGDA